MGLRAWGLGAGSSSWALKDSKKPSHGGRLGLGFEGELGFREVGRVHPMGRKALLGHLQLGGLRVLGAV